MNLDEINDLLADMPPKFGASELAAFLNISIDRFYARRTMQMSGKSPDTLPQPIPLGGKALIYSRAGLRVWLIAKAEADMKKRQGRPPGSTSRRGIGRSELEARNV